MQVNQLKQQQGMTFLGLVIVLAAVIFIAIIGLKLVPAYLEHMGVKKSLTYVTNESGFTTMSDADIRKAFDKSADIGYVTVVHGKDIVIKKTDTGTELSIDYQVVKPIAGNVSALLDFSATAKK